MLSLVSHHPSLVSACCGEPSAQRLQRLQAKQAVIADLIAGRLTLLEAVLRFRRCDMETPAPEEDGEQTARAVIGWAHLALRERPEHADAVGDRLEGELCQHLARHGVFRLACA
jgi:hypothetical protein